MTEGAASQPSYSAVAAHGIQVTVEFKPIEHPIEPLDNDQPIQCPVTEPSVLNVEAMLDKSICAMSSVFVGSAGSTFTEDILRLGKDWDSGSSCDETKKARRLRCWNEGRRIPLLASSIVVDWSGAEQLLGNSEQDSFYQCFLSRRSLLSPTLVPEIASEQLTEPLLP